LLMGLRRSGKSSIQKVVFSKMTPNETLYLETTNKIVKNDISNSSFVQFQVWDFPGQLNFLDSAFDSEAMFSQCGALVYVVDSQDDTHESLTRLHKTIVAAYQANPKINFEIFIHKVDGLSDDHRMKVKHTIQRQVSEDLAEAKLSDESVSISYHLTSIYDHSIFEGFSKVVQKLIPEIPTLESLLDILNTKCAVEKSFLVDVVSKIYVATDSSPVDTQQYELCSDMIDVVIDVSCIYGMAEGQEGLAYDPKTKAVISLNSDMVLYMREVNQFLALVCLLRKEHFERQGILEFNFEEFKNAITKVFEVRTKKNTRKK